MFGNIYIIDDDRMGLCASRHKLEIYANAISCYDSNLKAIDAILKLEKSSSLPFIVFLDIQLPLDDSFYFMEVLDSQDDEFKGRCKIVLLASSILIEEINNLLKHSLVVSIIPKPIDQDAIKMVFDLIGLVTPISY